MKLRRMRMVSILCGLMLAASLGCQSLPDRRPLEESLTDPAFHEANVADVVVLPVRAGTVVADDRFPAYEMREMLRGYLIQEKDYAVPRAEWVDVEIAEGQGGELLTDALLEVSVDQWDSTVMATRGVIYASASFELRHGKDGRSLWTYRCEDLQIPVEEQIGLHRDPDSPMTVAARKLTATALSRLPRK